MTENVAQLLTSRAVERPDLVLGTHDDPIRLADAIRCAAGRASALLRLTEAGRLVAMVGETSTDYLITWMACVLAGTPVALINPTYPVGLLSEMIEDFRPTVLLSSPELAPEIGWTGPVMSIEGARNGKGGVEVQPGLASDPLATVSFMHTSGTTGRPKFCAQSHAYFLRLGADVAAAMSLTAQDRVFAPLPMFHINPLGYGLFGALTAGADVLAVRKFSASMFWQIVSEERITALVLHAPPVAILNRRDASESEVPKRVRTMFYADATFMRRFGIPHAVSGYGSTEAGGLSHLKEWRADDDIPEDASRHGGPPRKNIQWRLDGVGQILVRATRPGVLFDGYLQDGQLSAPFDDNGWFPTGDFGRRDEDGNLVFVERASESIRVKGEFVPIHFVEDHIGRVHGIDDLALWKRPGTLVDDEVVLYVVTDSIPLAALRQASAELPAFMRPRAVIRTARLPRDAAAGKVQRRLLGEQPILEEVPL
ncbi:ATP-dependent acyl-CoA ligase [Acrocarpospora pleiomorpha]|uniref:ATP-dependent acyl-CoA ligase n=1 Tax=Acrocarpospora pleiomorpha TaxID=90975 RepID=A0A5M3XWY2_9ACTN|nr:class I adenylate-forming enzyme family protein [Acrocarpospora pleiomorpha]GES23893.1 ATP-dependent acyl-CoA ligase [Acrocarpospora pleiomorpha]